VASAWAGSTVARDEEFNEEANPVGLSQTFYGLLGSMQLRLECRLGSREPSIVRAKSLGCLCSKKDVFGITEDNLRDIIRKLMVFG